MTVQLPSTSQMIAVGRHVATSAATVVTVLSVLHILTGDQAQTVNNSIGQIVQGVGLIWAGLGPIIAIGSALWAAYAQSMTSHIKAVNNAPNGAKVVAATAPFPTVTAPLK